MEKLEAVFQSFQRVRRGSPHAGGMIADGEFFYLFNYFFYETQTPCEVPQLSSNPSCQGWRRGEG